MTMLWLVFMMVALIPVSQAIVNPYPFLRGGTSCNALFHRYGDICYSDTKSHPRPGATLKYEIKVQGNAEICCKAFTCTIYSCSMTYIGCGRNNWSSSHLQREGDRAQTPQMQCKSVRFPGWTVYYKFETLH